MFVGGDEFRGLIYCHLELKFSVPNPNLEQYAFLSTLC